jgi:hypothetical protein
VPSNILPGEVGGEPAGDRARMPLPPPDPGWIAILTTAAQPEATDPGVGLRLAWATEGAVMAATARRELWWQRLAEAVAHAAADIDLLPGGPGVRLGTGPAPAGLLTDTAGLRDAVRRLLSSMRDALDQRADRTGPAGERLAVALAAGAVARAVAVAR